MKTIADIFKAGRAGAVHVGDKWLIWDSVHNQWIVNGKKSIKPMENFYKGTSEEEAVKALTTSATGVRI